MRSLNLDRSVTKRVLAASPPPPPPTRVNFNTADEAASGHGRQGQEEEIVPSSTKIEALDKEMNKLYPDI